MQDFRILESQQIFISLLNQKLSNLISHKKKIVSKVNHSRNKYLTHLAAFLGNFMELMFRREIMEKSPFVWNQVCNTLLGLASLPRVFECEKVLLETKALLQEFAFVGGASIPSSLLSGNCLMVLLHFRPELATLTLENKLDKLKSIVIEGFQSFLDENQIIFNETNFEIFLKRQLSTLLTVQITGNWKQFVDFEKSKS